MASNTPYLRLYKKDPLVDAKDTFNIQTMLNDNWDKIDTAMGKKSRFVLSAVEPVDADENTFWFEDRGDSPIDVGSGGDGVVVANASTDESAGTDILFKEVQED